MRQLAKRLAAWWDGGQVRWHLPLGSGWQVVGRFSNCVSKKCLMRRVKQIVEMPREPPSHIYKLADTALDYLVGVIHDVELHSYEVRLGVSADGGRFPELFLVISLTYDAYDCPDSDDELCEGWWLAVVAKYDVESEWCAVEWSRYIGTDRRMLDVDAVLRVAYKALKHAYNAKV